MQPDLNGAALTALRFLLKYGRGSLPVDPAAMLRSLPGVRLLPWDAAQGWLRERGYNPGSLLMLHGAVGALQLASEEGCVILLMPDQPPAIRRHTLAHELGHILLGHENESREVDREANCFAAQLLIPTPVLAHLCEQQPRPTLWELRNWFGVSRDLLELVLRGGAPIPEGFSQQERRRLIALFDPYEAEE